MQRVLIFQRAEQQCTFICYGHNLVKSLNIKPICDGKCSWFWWEELIQVYLKKTETCLKLNFIPIASDSIFSDFTVYRTI